MPTKNPVNAEQLRSLARSYTRTALKVLAGVAMSPKATDSARVSAAEGLLSRGWGKPSQAVEMTVEDRREREDVMTWLLGAFAKPTKPTAQLELEEPTKH